MFSPIEICENPPETEVRGRNLIKVLRLVNWH
jgi:hypothetical protein